MGDSNAVIEIKAKIAAEYRVKAKCYNTVEVRGN